MDTNREVIFHNKALMNLAMNYLTGEFEHAILIAERARRSNDTEDMDKWTARAAQMKHRLMLVAGTGDHMHAYEATTGEE